MSWIDLHENERGSFIYHYTRWETLIQFILPTGELRIGPFGSTNDVYDFRHWDMMGRGVGNPEQFKDVPTAYEPFMSLKNRCNLIAFSSDPEDGSLDDINRRGFGILPMWGLYANRFSGCCLIIDRLKLEEEIHTKFNNDSENIYSGKIKYELPSSNDDAFIMNINEIRDQGIEKYLVEHLNQHHHKLLFSKHNSWSYENEYRIVVVAKEPGEIFINIHNSLCGIVLGYSCRLTRSVVESFSRYNFELKCQAFDYGKQHIY